MKLLFDQNLSPDLVNRLSDLFPESTHVFEVGLDQEQDIKIWEYARKSGYIIVSKDSDFNEMSIVQGIQPKVIWIRRGNCSTKEIENIVRRNKERINKLQESEHIGILLLY